MTNEEAREFAIRWINAWNKHDMEEILSHYTEDFVMTSPMIQQLMGMESGTLRGKRVVADYWRTALQKVPDLKFTLLDVTSGVNSVSIYYESVMNKKVIETFFVQENGKIFKANATYS